jgi:cytochrome c553
LIRALLAGIALAWAVPAASQPKVCLDCHGERGVSTRPLTPSLGGQQAFYVTAQLLLFREGRRENRDMTPVAANLTDEQLQKLGEEMAALPPPAAPKRGRNAAKYARGRALAERERCGTCHNADFSGGENVPRIANQREDYLRKALSDYKKGERAGFGNALMPETLAGLKAGELADLAHFLAYLER